MKSLNVSTLEDGNTDRTVFAQVALASTYLVLTVLATVGNVCVFIINFRWRSGVAKFKITSIFLLNLALTDIGIAVGNLPFAFVSSCLNRWVFGEVFCVVNGFVAIYLPVVSITTILMITVHRALVVLCPFRRTVNRTSALVACVVSWMWSLIVPIPPLFGISHYEYSPVRGFCRVAFVQTAENYAAKLGNIYSMISVTLFVILPLFVITILNLLLLLTSWRLQLNTPQPILTHRHSSLRRKSTQLGDQKAFKTVTLVVGAFILCWLPQVLITFIGIAVKNQYNFPPPSLATFQALLVMANSTMNPFIYTYVNKDFRSRFFQILLCKGMRRSAGSQRPGNHGNTRGVSYRRESQERVLNHAEDTLNSKPLMTNDHVH